MRAIQRVHTDGCTSLNTSPCVQGSKINHDTRNRNALSPSHHAAAVGNGPSAKVVARARFVSENTKASSIRLIDVEKDERGFVRSFKMTWLRNGGPKLPQMEFAHQAADLLRAMHDIARVIHLDLRMDNMVITDEGVGFIDFGSASRVGEELDTGRIHAVVIAYQYMHEHRFPENAP